MNQQGQPRRSILDDLADLDGPGLRCRSCGCRHFRVIYTRPRGDGAIVRRRECRHCGRRITTYEREPGTDAKTKERAD